MCINYLVLIIAKGTERQLKTTSISQCRKHKAVASLSLVRPTSCKQFHLAVLSTMNSSIMCVLQKSVKIKESQWLIIDPWLSVVVVIVIMFLVQRKDYKCLQWLNWILSWLLLTNSSLLMLPDPSTPPMLHGLPGADSSHCHHQCPQCSRQPQTKVSIPQLNKISIDLCGLSPERYAIPYSAWWMRNDDQ